MNYFEATQSAYTRTPVRLPEWGDGKYVFWGTVTVTAIKTDGNGIASQIMKNIRASVWQMGRWYLRMQ
ncbi:hypothetical protein KP12_352 [Klebsiella phage KP12]|uniref:Uncharacterized protein n=1 Tax=Klebsiella phage KP12 TaxID=2923374 RepID=A0A9E7CLB3_9CAUD|nr:hypothetical protein KP12_352 [Klebsiella phage KP12]